jgi:3'-5' exoribonuclease
LKKVFVDMLSSGQVIDEIFLVRQKQLAHKKDGNPYLILTLTDRTGSIKAVAWDNVQNINGNFGVGDYVRVNGTASEYRDTLQVTVKHLERCEGDAVATEDFIPRSDRDPGYMMDRLIDACSVIENTYLSKLLDAFFEDELFVESFKKAPAAKNMHHAYLGGLLEHTLSIVLLIQQIAGHYEGIDNDLLITGAVLHDIGKTHEFCYESHIDYSDAGRLLSHIVIGLEMLEKKIATIKDFPDELALLLKHMIVSHHGSRDFGSPEPPKTLEAVMLNYLDELDSKVNGIRSFMASEDPDSAWTSYHRVLERFFYKGRQHTDEEQ